MIISSYLIILFLHLSSTQSLTNFNVTDELDHTDDEHRSFKGISRRSRRDPAVWGEPAPDYSKAQLNDYVHFLNALIFVDSKITNHYGSDVERVKGDVMKLVQEANNYFYQINIRIIVVDILQTYRNDLSLYSFEEYRNHRISKLPTHDFAALISHRYAGGLAFVNGMCTSKNIMLCGFYPHNPSAMGGIFFHEVAHLFGVAHHNQSDLIDIPNCYCPVIQSTTNSGCLKIPGYDHDCTLQQMVNMVEKNRCLRHHKMSKFFFTQHQVEKSLPLCGNGIIEGKEECDCGLHKLCSNWNCRADECLQIVKTWQMQMFGCVVTVISMVAIIFYVIRRCSQFCYDTLSYCNCNNNHFSCDCFLKLLSNFKSIIRPKNNHFWHRPGSNYGQSLRLTSNDITLAKHHFIGISQKPLLNGMSVLIKSDDKEYLIRKSRITRPTKPPPPPPSSSSSIAPREVLQQSMHTVTLSPLERSPPPLPIKPSNLALKMTVTSSDDSYEMSNTVRKRLSSAIRSNAIDNLPQSDDHYNDHYDSISRKFDDDFDDDFDDNDGMLPEEQHELAQYTTIVPMKERLFEKEEKRTTLHHLDQRNKLSTHEESFSSNESRNQPYPSDDTVSTGLSEEDERFISVTDIVRKFNVGKL